MSIDSGYQLSGGSASPAEMAGRVGWPAFCAGLSAAILFDVGMADWSLRERVLLAVVAVLAVVVGLLLKRHRLSSQRLAVERRHLSIAVNNIPQGLVLYDASARIIICNQRYIEMFGLSPEVAKPGCTNAAAGPAPGTGAMQGQPRAAPGGERPIGAAPGHHFHDRTPRSHEFQN